jgi:hypothetical protein
VLGADADAVEALHAAGVDDRAVVAHLLVHADVARADRGAVAAALAIVVHPDPQRRELIDDAEDPAVRAAVGAEPLRAEHVDGREAADDERRDRHPRVRERLQKASVVRRTVGDAGATPRRILWTIGARNM